MLTHEPLPERDRRELRRYNLAANERNQVDHDVLRGPAATAASYSARHAGFMTRRPLKCRNYNRTSGFEIAIDEHDGAMTTKGVPMRRTIIVPKESWS